MTPTTDATPAFSPSHVTSELGAGHVYRELFDIRAWRSRKRTKGSVMDCQVRGRVPGKTARPPQLRSSRKMRRRRSGMGGRHQRKATKVMLKIQLFLPKLKAAADQRNILL